MNYINMEYWWNDDERRKLKHSEKKTSSSATLSNTNPTWTTLGLNPGLYADRSSTKHLSHDQN
jgi:hypothetical protein